MSAYDSVPKTAQPTETKRIDALSTGPQQTKKDVKRNLMNMDVSTESLGILSLDDMRTSKDSLAIIHSTSSQTAKILEERQSALESTRALLKKYENLHNQLLPTESTVNESDLQDPSNSGATPSRESAGSTINESDLLNKSDSINYKQNQSLMNQRDALSTNATHSKTFGDLEACASSQSIVEYIRDIQAQLEANSTASLSDILGNVSRQSLECDSGMFQSSEDVKDRFARDEEVWRAKYAPLPTASRVSITSQPNSALFDEKMSFGNYFAAKSDNCSLFKVSSPTRCQPMALLNSTAIDSDDVSVPDISAISQSPQCADRRSDSVLSLSQIRNLIAGEEDAPGKLVERLLAAPMVYRHEKSARPTPALREDGYYRCRSSLGSPSVRAASQFRYASSADLRTSQVASSTRIYAAKSLGSFGDDKENVSASSSVAKNRTLTSCGSTSSMDSMPDGCVQLASNKAELVWGCVREGRAVQQDVTVRNKNNRRVKYLIQTTNPTFKVSNVGPQGAIVLHALETRQLRVTCAPNAPGPQTGHLLFAPVVRKKEAAAQDAPSQQRQQHQQQQPQQHVALYAYGGHAHVRVEEVARDLAGRLWLSFGAPDGRRAYVRRFVVRNAGSVDGFVALRVRGRHPCAFEEVGVEPARALIAPGAATQVVVTFRPSRSDLQLLAAAAARTSEIAVVTMMSGAEVSRRRINRVVGKMGVEEDARRDPFVQLLGASYRNARRDGDDDDARHFDESIKSFKALMQTLEYADISLLVDGDHDATLLPEPDDDASVLFKTMVCPDDSARADRVVADDDDERRACCVRASVEPSKVILVPPTKRRDCFLLASNCDGDVEFRAFVDRAEGLTLKPSAGRVRPGEIVPVAVECACVDAGAAREEFEVVFEVHDAVLKVAVSVLNM